MSRSHSLRSVTENSKKSVNHNKQQQWLTAAQIKTHLFTSTKKASTAVYMKRPHKEHITNTVPFQMHLGNRALQVREDSDIHCLQ